MSAYKPIKTSITEARRLEQVEADTAKLQADLLYIAMMADVDLEEVESNE